MSNDKSEEVARTMRDFFGQFDSKDPAVLLVLDVLFRVIYNVPEEGIARQIADVAHPASFDSTHVQGS